MKRYLFIGIVLLLLVPMKVGAQSADISTLSAQGVAIYGWRDGVPTVFYIQNDTQPFPIASITKLVTAKAVEILYPQNSTITISASAAKDLDSNGLMLGMTFSRDDLLRALLISSNNEAGRQFAEGVGDKVFLDTMNAFLHDNGYLSPKVNFINPTGLDPNSKATAPNQFTATTLSTILSDIYRNDPLLTSILEQKSAVITDQNTGMTLSLKSSDELNNDPLYGPHIILSKTGTTALAQQTVAFVTNGQGKYDYITVVLLHSKDRATDGKRILDWLQEVLRYNS
ncbi:MAG: peptidase D-alanyl-D-alanine carboxypeptidase 1 [Candidatus Nomurabacteria bacterium]|jgi:D-alanyl-D-alanine carboxypeptidase|nr:peptidase D-alanyl-D-alanine carboxypeptidase 1 [Candidatus Nomurabacteria bacterium]